MDRLFLDANVLYSAAYKRESSLRRLWELPDVELVSTGYAIDEARRNLCEKRPAKVSDLDALVERLRVHPGPPTTDALPNAIVLAVKDRPILWAAIDAKATHLLTGDKRHFALLFGRNIGGVLILMASEYVRSRLAGT